MCHNYALTLAQSGGMNSVNRMLWWTRKLFDNHTNTSFKKKRVDSYSEACSPYILRILVFIPLILRLLSLNSSITPREGHSKWDYLPFSSVHMERVRGTRSLSGQTRSCWEMREGRNVRDDGVRDRRESVWIEERRWKGIPLIRMWSCTEEER